MAATVSVYVIESRADGMLYVGRTTDVARRLATHNSGGSAFTARHRPWELLVSIALPDAAVAYRLEKYLKTGSGRAFMRRHFAPTGDVRPSTRARRPLGTAAPW